ncbi:MAG: hypothetical protein WKF87_09395 [Chryseolinea sp.]
MKKLQSITYVFLICATLSACNDDNDSNAPQDKGLSKEISALVPAEILQKLKNLGMPIHEGLNPPDIQIKFHCSPLVLKATNVKDDIYDPGHVFADYFGTFYDQDNDKLTIKMDYTNGPETGTGLGSFISGTGSDFSVFAEIEGEAHGDKARLIQVLSGTITNTGIKNLHLANFMLEGGDESEYWIDNGEGRVTYDSDGHSELE